MENIILAATVAGGFLVGFMVGGFYVYEFMLNRNQERDAIMRETIASQPRDDA